MCVLHTFNKTIMGTFCMSFKCVFQCCRVASHLEITEFREKSAVKNFDKKVWEIHEKMFKSGKFVREKWNCFANVLENVDMALFFPHCQMIGVISVIFCYTGDKLELEKPCYSQKNETYACTKMY